MAPYRLSMRNDDAGLAWEILQRFDDPATGRFDEALAAADLPEDVRRVLRFWQRESVANVRQFAAEALPAVLHAIGTARDDAARATRRAAAALPGASAPGDWTDHSIADVVIELPDVTPREDRESARLLEERRRTVAARLAQLG